MNIKELHLELVRLKIDENDFYLHGLYGATDDNEKTALQIKQGKYRLEYEIYFKERGEKHSVRIFYEEEKACAYFLEQFNS